MKTKPKTIAQCLQEFVDCKACQRLMEESMAALKRLSKKMAKAGRASAGKAGPKQKLSDEQKAEVRRMQATNHPAFVADQFGISIRTVRRIWGDSK